MVMCVRYRCEEADVVGKCEIFVITRFSGFVGIPKIQISRSP